MDYTKSNGYETHAATGNRYHDDDKPIATTVSQEDLNSVMWSLMEVVKTGGGVAKSFSRDVPATYQQVLVGIKGLIVSHSGKAEYAGRVNHTRFTSKKPSRALSSRLCWCPLHQISPPLTSVSAKHPPQTFTSSALSCTQAQAIGTRNARENDTITRPRLNIAT